MEWKSNNFYLLNLLNKVKNFSNNTLIHKLNNLNYLNKYHNFKLYNEPLNKRFFPNNNFSYILNIKFHFYIKHNFISLLDILYILKHFYVHLSKNLHCKFYINLYFFQKPNIHYHNFFFQYILQFLHQNNNHPDIHHK